MCVHISDEECSVCPCPLFVVRGCLDERYINVCNNMYLDHLKLCTLMVEYVCCSECYVVSNECDDICMCVVNKQFDLLEFVFNSVYITVPHVDAVTVMCGLLILLDVCIQRESMRVQV